MSQKAGLVRELQLVVEERQSSRAAVAGRAFAKGDVLESFAERIVAMPSKYTLQIGAGKHLDTTGSPAAFCNHSCAPNSYFVAETLQIVALEGIREGEAVTLNYLNSEWDMASPFDCDCGKEACFNFIRGFRYLDGAGRQKLLASALPYIRQLTDLEFLRPLEDKLSNCPPEDLLSADPGQAPCWPAGSIASLSDTECWQRDKARGLAGQIVDHLPGQKPSRGPLAVGSAAGHKWVTSGQKAARLGATEAYVRARRDMALTGYEARSGLEESLQELLRCADGRGTIDTHGGYMAYAPTAALFEGALAAFSCAAINPGLTWMPTSPQYAAMERCVLDWVAAEVLKWPASSSGVFTSGGSVANTLGLHVAREAVAEKAGVRPADVVFFLPAHAHYCFRKGLRVLGVDPAQIVEIPSETNGRIAIAALVRVIEDAARRRAAFAGVLIAVGGETSTGQVDPLETLADICAQTANLWLHVDGCFGGFFALTKRGASLLGGIDKADSVALDPHKALQAPYGVGLLMVQNEGDMRRAFATSAAYTPPASLGEEQEGISDIADLGLELTREARAAQVWLPLRAYGTGAFAQHLDWCQDAILWVASALRAATDQLEIVSEPQLSTLTLRLRTSFSLITRRELAEWLADEVNVKGRILVAPTALGDHLHCVRICILSARTRPEHLQILVQDLVEAAATITGCAHRLEKARSNPARSLGFRVPYLVRPIPGKGLAVVACEDVSEGALVWEFEEGACLATNESAVRNLAEEKGRDAAQDYLNHCFCWGGQLLYPQGDTQFFNHAKDPNIASTDARSWLARRPIAAGEEIVDDYGTYEVLEPFERLCDEFGVESSAKVAATFRS